MTFQDGNLRVGIGIPTYNRPDFLKRAVESVDTHIGHQLSVKLIYDDGSTIWDEDFYEGLINQGWTIMRAEENKGVAWAKHQLLAQLMTHDCEMLILMEDDIVVKSPRTIEAYAGAISHTGIHHLNWAHHGDANIGGLVEQTDMLELWRNVSGAFSVYTSECLRATGNFDTEFGNDLDHVHHTYMLWLNGYTTPWRAFADVRGSDRLLGEQPGAIEQSTIGHTDIMERGSSFQRSLRHWITNYPCPNDLLWLLR